MIEVHPEGCICEPCSDISPNWKDIRTKFGYTTSGCVKTHVCMKNKSYTPLKSKNKVKNSRNLGVSHSLTLDDIPLNER